MPDKIIENHNFAIIGREEAVISFKAIGFDTYPIINDKSVRDAIKEIVSKAIKICLVEESFFVDNKDLFIDFKEKTFPIFVPFSVKESKGSMEELVKEIRLKATGKI